MANPTPNSPFGIPVEVLKPGIPIPTWSDHGEVTIDEVK